mmetsp:Transcript_28675/g.73259  ORF Transcript_28675/g.73259 Transcript_28675/m.73259 type:complete len:202 (-) Transcript_28675:1599-2204(-)
MGGRKEKDRKELVMERQPVLDQVFHHGRVGKRGDVSKLVSLTSCNLAQNATHDFARPRLWQTGREVDELGCGEGPNFMSDHLYHLFCFRLCVVVIAFHLFPELILQRDVRIDTLPFDVVWEGNNSSFSYIRMKYKCALHLSCSNSVSAHVDHIIHPSCYAYVVIAIALRAITTEVVPFAGAEVGLFKSGVIAVYCSCLPRP